ncbi:MAG: hypothetical protein Q8P12_07145 [bacterium]|nr:hypothetical protein [bacterium]
MGLPLKLRLWRFYPNPIRRHNFSTWGWGLQKLPRKIWDFLTIRPPQDIAERLDIFGEYDAMIDQGLVNLRFSSLIEVMIASDISAAIKAEGIRPFPPVIFKIYPPPFMTVVSQRKRIERSFHLNLMNPYLSDEEREEMEQFIEEAAPDFSAFVTGIGGIAVLPPIINFYRVRTLMGVAAHEWTHYYLRMFPLGRQYKKETVNPINELTCRVVEREIAQRIYARYGWEEEDEPPQKEFADALQSYEELIGEIRQEVDRLLSLELVEEAEEFMEARCEELRERWPLRKINQAFFAFHGAYGGAEAGADPTPRQVRELRERSGSLQGFLERIRGVDSREGFEKILAELEID